MCDQGKSSRRRGSSSWRTLGLSSLLVLSETQQPLGQAGSKLDHSRTPSIPMEVVPSDVM